MCNMDFIVSLISLDADFNVVPVRDVTVTAEDAFAATLAATDLITKAEASHVFASIPATPAR